MTRFGRSVGTMLGYGSGLLILLHSLAVPVLPQTPEPAKAIVFIIAEFESGTPDFGTGFFVDHDGLIVTADHVLHKYPVLSEDSTASPPPGALAKKIRIYSTVLTKYFEIDLAKNRESIVTGDQLGAGKWLDLALIRISLDASDRERIRPLDLAIQPLTQTATVNAYGPACNDFTKPKCLKPEVEQRTIKNVPETSNWEEYKISAIVAPGYSGGPLVEVTTGKVAGVCSYGVRLPRQQELTYIQVYVPAFHVRYFRPFPRKLFFATIKSCSALRGWDYVTWFDIRQLEELIRPLLSGSACSCLCLIMSKNPSGIDPPGGEKERTQFLDCAPPWCKVDAAYEALNRLTNAARAGATDQKSVKSWLDFSLELFEDFLKAGPKIESKRRATLYKSYGDFFYKVANGTLRLPSGMVPDGRTVALRAYAESVEIDSKQADVWRSMGYLLSREKDRKQAIAALVIARESGLPCDSFASDLSYFGALQAKRNETETDKLLGLAYEAHQSTMMKGAYPCQLWPSQQLGLDRTVLADNVISKSKRPLTGGPQ